MAGKSTISIAFTLTEDANGLKRLTASAKDFREVMQETVKVSTELQSNFINFAALSTSVRSMSDSLNQVVGTLNNLTAESEEFSKAMREANTMAGKDSAGFKQLKGEVASLAKEIPIARDQLANGLYQTISNGVPEDNWVEFLNTSARSAVGGLADINKVVGVTSTLIKNYGLEWSAAADIQDKIQLTAKNGVTSFELLAQALPRVAGNASTLGVSIDELMGTFATLTGVSGNTAEVSTQLAAIFTSLVKPSSEAAEMAAAMGIQFDAAAIKAAGGFQNFLTKLDTSVKAYAQATGTLEQEIYGRLFGSAEALRALIPLQGELSDKFAANVSNMVNSAGTMDAAYAEMGSTGEAVIQKLKNKFGSLTDTFSGVVSGIRPVLAVCSELGSSTASIIIIIESFKKFNRQAESAAKNAKAFGVAVNILRIPCRQLTIGVRSLGSALHGGAVSANALKIGLRGLLITTGIGAAITTVTAVISYFASTTDDATESLKKLDGATDDYTQAAAAAKVQIDRDIKSLGDLINSKKDTKEALQRLNETYGEFFGVQKTAEEMYKTLTEKSQLYVKQMGYEAQARALASKIAENAIQRELTAEKKGEWERSNKNKMRRGRKDIVTGTTEFYSTDDEWKDLDKSLRQIESDGKALQHTLDIIGKKIGEVSADASSGLANATAAVKVNDMTLQQVSRAIEETEKKLKNTTDGAEIKRLRVYNEQLKARKKTLESMTGLDTRQGKKKTAVADPKTYEELSTNIEIYKKKLTGADTEEQCIIREKIARWIKAREAIEQAQKQAERPTTLTTLEDIDREISYQRALRQRATAENIAGIDAEIRRLEELRDELDRSGFVPTPIAGIKTYEQLNKELAHYTALLEKADATQRIVIQKSINDLEELKKAWDYILDDLKKPGDISTLDTIEKLDDAISYYQQKQKRASGEEIQNTQRVINALQKKRNALQRGIEIPSMLEEAAEINKLTGREYKIKIAGMGFDELTAKINELNRLLNDTDHPVTASQRKDIESLIATYERWRKEGIDAFDTFRTGWDSIKGIGSGIDGITNALEGNGNAWQTVTGIVDGFLQIYDGIKTIVGIINMLSLATDAQTTAEVTKTAALGTSAGALGAEAVAAEATAAAQIPVIAANKLATASFMELAAAAYFAAHAPIPFAGFGIASGFISAATTMVQTIGVMPFANGGIVSGPTVGLIGEYAGASNNPEVVAPLDKLRGMLHPAGEPVIVGGTLRASGRELICVLANETRIARKSGKRTNIKL